MGWIVILGFVMLVGLGAYLTASRLFRQPRGLPLALATAILGWTWITIGVQTLGTLGFLNRIALFGLAISGVAIGWWFHRTRPLPPNELTEAPSNGKIVAWWTLSLLIGSALIVGTPSVLLPPKIVSDGPIYHLFFAAKWWKAGRIFLIASPFGENAATYFPANGDLWFSTLMTLFDGDRPARVGQAPFLLLAGMSAFAIARRLGAGVSASVIGAAWGITSFPLLLYSFEANVDTIFVAGYVAAIYFGLRYALGDDGPASLILGGAAAGLAWGTKPTATAFIPPLIVMGWLIVLARPLSRREKWGHALIVTITPLIGCGFWFGRSLWLTGNPLYPMHVEALGRVWLAGWFRSADMSKSQFYLPLQDWKALVSIQMTVLDPRLVPFWVAAWLGAWTWGRKGTRLDRWVWALSILSVANIAIYWLAIPYRTQQRFMLQALVLGSVPLARLFHRSAVLRFVGAALLTIHLTTRQSWPFVAEGVRAFWELSEKIPSVAPAPVQMALSPSQWVVLYSRPGGLEYLALLGGVLIASFGLGWLWTRSLWTRTLRLRGLATVASVLVTTVYVLLLDTVSGESSRRVFPIFAEYQNAWASLDRFSPPSGTNVAYAGTNLPLMLMGGGHRNDVFYVNVDRHTEWLMHDYHLTAADRGDPPLWSTPRPGWDRVHPVYEDWLENLRRKRITLLVVAKANPIDGPFNIADDEQFTIERVWADAHPESFTRLYPREGKDPQMKIYRVHPPET